MNLLMTEMRRALHRRAVRVLIAIALAGCAFAGCIAYLTSRGKTIAQTLAAYLAVIVGGAAISFQRRDIAAGS